MAEDYPTPWIDVNRIIERFDCVCPVCEGEIVSNVAGLEIFCVTCNWSVELGEPEK